MKVSVIIPVYNEEKVILDCLESLGQQDYPDFEIIVVDDGSTDSTHTLVANATKLTPAIKLVQGKHKGAGPARNLAAQYAKGEILVFVDADMTFAPDFLTKLIAPIGHNGVIGSFSKQEFLENKNNPWAVIWNLNRGLPKDKMHPPNYPDQQKVFRAILKSEFDKAGGFNEKGGYTDDYSLYATLGKLAQNAPGAIFYHKNPDNLKEIFSQSKWMAKRKYKLGAIGSVLALVRVSLPVSLIVGLVNALRYAMPAYLVFKIVSDLAQFLGILEYNLNKSVAK